MFVKMYTMGMGRFCGLGKDQIQMFQQIQSFECSVRLKIFISKQYMYILSVSISWNAFDLILSDPI